MKRLLLLALFLLPAPLAAQDDDRSDHTGIIHEDYLFYLAAAEIDAADSDAGTLFTWDAHGWVGGDYHKLWLRAEGERDGGETEKSETWAMYSRNVAEFWDMQAGLRQDFAPESVTYAVIGVHGLAPYWFETDIHAFVSDAGDLSARLEQSIDLPITQQLITEPYLEASLFAQDVPELHAAAGLSEFEIGLQTRYEITRKFAPYLDLNYTRHLGEAADFVRADGDDPSELTARIGLRFWF